MSDGTKGSWWLAGGVGLGLGGLGGCFDAGLAIFDGVSTWLGYRAAKNGMRRRYVRNLSPAEYKEFRREERRDGDRVNDSLQSWYVWDWRPYERERWRYAEGRMEAKGRLGMAVEGRYALPWAGAEWQAEIIKIKKEEERRARIKRPLKECGWLEKLERQQQYDRGLRAARAGIPEEIWRGNWRDPDYDYRDESKFRAYCRDHPPFTWTVWAGKPLPCTKEGTREMEEWLQQEKRDHEAGAIAAIRVAKWEEERVWKRSHPSLKEEFMMRIPSLPDSFVISGLIGMGGGALIVWVAAIIINLLIGRPWNTFS